MRHPKARLVEPLGFFCQNMRGKHRRNGWVLTDVKTSCMSSCSVLVSHSIITVDSGQKIQVVVSQEEIIAPLSHCG